MATAEEDNILDTEEAGVVVAMPIIKLEVAIAVTSLEVDIAVIKIVAAMPVTRVEEAIAIIPPLELVSLAERGFLQSFQSSRVGNNVTLLRHNFKEDLSSRL